MAVGCCMGGWGTGLPLLFPPGTCPRHPPSVSSSVAHPCRQLHLRTHIHTRLLRTLSTLQSQAGESAFYEDCQPVFVFVAGHVGPAGELPGLSHCWALRAGHRHLADFSPPAPSARTWGQLNSFALLLPECCKNPFLFFVFEDFYFFKSFKGGLGGSDG